VADGTKPDAVPAGRCTDLRTFLIADIRGYTRYTREFGDERASAVAVRFAAIVGGVVPDFDGELLELRGDEALCVFSSARQALRAGVELQRRLRMPAAGEEAFPLGVGVVTCERADVVTQAPAAGDASQDVVHRHQGWPAGRTRPLRLTLGKDTPHRARAPRPLRAGEGADLMPTARLRRKGLYLGVVAARNADPFVHPAQSAVQVGRLRGRSGVAGGGAPSTEGERG
jgi:hypothetical protein